MTYAVQLKQYYSSRQITQGDELIPMDKELFDFPYSQDINKELQEIAKILITTINSKIIDSSPQESIKNRRYIDIDTREPPYLTTEHKLINPQKKEFATDEEYHRATYLGSVIYKLIDMGLIYQATHHGHGWSLQA